MAKQIAESKTIRDHTIAAFLTALSGAILAVSPDLREMVPNWVYVPLLLLANMHGIWRRIQTTEPIQKEGEE
jgi:hypothetical protein